MEIPEAINHKKIIFLYEGLATALFVFIINLSAGSPLIPFAAVCVVFTNIIFLAPITGAHFNPAITAGIFLQLPNKRKNFPMFLTMTLGQFTGAFLGAFLAYFAMGLQYRVNEEAVVVALLPQGNTDIWGALLAEIILSQFYVMTIMQVKSKKLSISDQLPLQALCPCVCLLCCVIATGSRSSAGMHPSFGLVQTIFQNQFGTEQQRTYKYMWCYIVGPYIGGCLAAGAHYLHKEAFYTLYPQKQPAWFLSAAKPKAIQLSYNTDAATNASDSSGKILVNTAPVNRIQPNEQDETNEP